jgi:hypothetical protein
MDGQCRNGECHDQQRGILLPGELVEQYLKTTDRSVDRTIFEHLW